MKQRLVLPSLLCLAFVACAGDGSQARRPVAILIAGGTVITLDPERRVLDDGAVAIVDDRMVAVGSRGNSPPGLRHASRLGSMEAPPEFQLDLGHTRAGLPVQGATQSHC